MATLIAEAAATRRTAADLVRGPYCDKIGGDDGSQGKKAARFGPYYQLSHHGLRLRKRRKRMRTRGEREREREREERQPIQEIAFWSPARPLRHLYHRGIVTIRRRRDFMVSRLLAANFKFSTNFRVLMYYNVYQVMYVEKNYAHFGIFKYFGISMYIFTSSLFARQNRWRFKMNGFLKHPGRNNRGDESRTILNKSAFLRGT